MQTYLGKHNSEFSQFVTDSFILSFKPIKGLIEELKQFNEDFDFSDLDPAHELYSEYNKNDIGKIKLNTTPDLNLDEAGFSGSNFYSLDIKQNNSRCKREGVKDQNQYTHKKIDNKKCCSGKFTSVPWVSGPSSKMTKRTTKTSKI